MRKLVTIRTINKIDPIPNADAIEVATVDGWQCVVKKGEFSVGDKCVYHEIDSLLPCKEPYTFLEKNGRKKIIENETEIEGYRLKTVILRKQLSQGLALPLKCFPGIPDELGTDVSDWIGVHKYEAPIPADIGGEIIGNLPSEIPVTDEERIQNLPNIFQEYAEGIWFATEKIDGTSCTYYKLNGHFGVCGRHREFSEKANNAFWQVALRCDLPSKVPEGIALQGELAGEGIQGNRLLLKGVDFYMFHALKINTRESLELEDMEIIRDAFGIKMVPVIDRDFSLKGHTVDTILKYVSRMSLLTPSRPLEGVVFRLKGARYKTSFKAISNRYLLGEKD